MHAENFAVDDGCQREKVEHLAAVLPHSGGPVLVQTLLVEAVHLCDLPGLVVAPYEGDFGGVLYLETHQKCERLETIVTPVHIVAEEDVIHLVWEPARRAEELQQVVELPVDVAADGYRGPHGLDVGLLHQELLH